MAKTDVLERELYTVQQASRLLRVPPSTLNWWLEGGKRHNKLHDPVLREAPTGSKILTWGEFVEARWLRTYRRDLGVSLRHLRRFITLLRDQLGIPYPLAHFQPFVGENAQLVIEAQKLADLEPELWLYVPATGAIPLPSPTTASYLTVVKFADEESGHAERIHPLGLERPVVFDPDYSFGEPTVEGVRTEVLVELVEAGEPIESIAKDYGITQDQVKAAVAYEYLDGDGAPIAA